MAVLFFSGDQVAFFSSIDENGSKTHFSDVVAPFRSDDVVEIEVPDEFIQPNGEFDPDEVQFTRVTVVRDGIRYDFDVDSGSKIKESGGSEIKEAGDTFFTTNDSVGPPGSGPFAGLETEKMVFATDATFTTGQTTDIQRRSHQDHNNDGDTSDAGEKGNANFNARQAQSMPCYAPGTLIETDNGPRPVEDLKAGDRVLTLDRGPQTILWVRAGNEYLETKERDQKPVLIAPGALGRGLPERSLIVSPQHRIFAGGQGQLDHVFA
ncbi:MAG: Hint domain-containing protein, partial [Pseudomonadota bacterium]